MKKNAAAGPSLSLSSTHVLITVRLDLCWWRVVTVHWLSSVCVCETLTDVSLPRLLYFKSSVFSTMSMTNGNIFYYFHCGQIKRRAKMKERKRKILRPQTLCLFIVQPHKRHRTKTRLLSCAPFYRPVFCLLVWVSSSLAKWTDDEINQDSVSCYPPSTGVRGRVCVCVSVCVTGHRRPSKMSSLNLAWFLNETHVKNNI